MNRNISGRVKAFVFERDKGKCVYCGSTENLEYDHIIPFSKGGSSSELNVQLVCAQCNRVKYNYIDDSFLKPPHNRKKGGNYFFNKKTRRSQMKIPREILEAENMKWGHKDELNLVVKTIDGQKGIFLFKKEKIDK